jgi:glycosyltransferase involved in cell wall biosynthesis
MSISIIVPTYNRRIFSKILSLNIRSQNYPLIKEILVGDDGDDNERLELDVPYTVLYYRVPRMSIGEKRNFLISKCSGDYIANMDTDDFYSPTYLSKSIFNLIKSAKSVSGSSDMLLMDITTKQVYRQRCIYLHMLNEATLVFKRSFGNIHMFSKSNSAEGIAFLEKSLNDIYETPIDDIMVCLAHEKNTVTKSVWCIPKYETTINMDKYSQHLIFSNDIVYG